MRAPSNDMVPGYLFEITASPMKFFRLHALFQSHALYGIVIWGHSSTAWNILLRQKRACASYHHLGIVKTAVPKVLLCSRFTSLYIYSALTKLRENVSDFRHRGGTSLITTLGGARFWMSHVTTLLRLKKVTLFLQSRCNIRYREVSETLMQRPWDLENSVLRGKFIRWLTSLYILPRPQCVDNRCVYFWVYNVCLLLSTKNMKRTRRGDSKIFITFCIPALTLWSLVTRAIKSQPVPLGDLTATLTTTKSLTKTLLLVKLEEESRCQI